MTKTRIYGTLGPSCDREETLYQMFREGMTGIRLNLSHTSLAESAGRIERLKKAAARAGTDCELLIDMQGPELRIGKLESDYPLQAGDTVLFCGPPDKTLCGAGSGPSSASCSGSAPDPVPQKRRIPIPLQVLKELSPGQEILLDDGRLLLAVTGLISPSAPGSDAGRPEPLAPAPGCVPASVLRGGILKSRKSIALPGKNVQLPAMTEADLANILKARDFGVTAVMQPFVRSASDLQAVRRALDEAGARGIRILAKIESMEGIAHLEELLPFADEFVIARGDLGNAMPLWELPAVQKRLAQRIKAAGRRLMIVTQMLHSMEHAAVPTRAEVCDIFNAVLDGADSCMLTGETAAGSYPAEAIRYLARTVREAEAFSSSALYGARSCATIFPIFRSQ